MKSYKDWKKKKGKKQEKQPDPPKVRNDRFGGLVPQDMKKAKHVDLITLPPDIKGTNCGNCKFMENNFCVHKEIQMPVNARMCCKYWDNEEVERPWGEMDD